MCGLTLRGSSNTVAGSNNIIEQNSVCVTVSYRGLGSLTHRALFIAPRAMPADAPRVSDNSVVGSENTLIYGATCVAVSDASRVLALPVLCALCYAS